MGNDRKRKGSVPPASRSDQRLSHEKKKKINSKPIDQHMEEIPYKLREIMKLRMEMDNPKKKRKRKPVRQGMLNSELQTDIPVPKFKRRKQESVGAYLNRMNQETQHVIFLSKNQLDRHPEMEEEVVGEAKEACVKKEKSQKKKEFDRRRLDKVLKKKEEKKEILVEKNKFKGIQNYKVQFGEVAMEPPTFTSKPRKSRGQTKPGEKQLLLKKLLEEESRQTNPAVMSLARKRLIDEERARVIQAYRQLKKHKIQPGKEISFPKS
ncbi:coiled-coil domain-containing protein 137 isoform X1 [Xenopus laevis]|uniref:Coiled-coil domain-containing protein 137 isoform X1 n=2 Tax=Xenopus laevis TaxID=8355 RepID=A0A8J1LZ38_XENLA|nr:coiled-coil domain-containing protein 137 isoform X1 [Xenopus laevis]